MYPSLREEITHHTILSYIYVYHGRHKAEIFLKQNTV